MHNTQLGHRRLCGAAVRDVKPARRMLNYAARRRAQLSVRASMDYEALQGARVLRADTGESVELLSLWQAQPGKRVVLPFLTHFGDLSSWEYAQKLVKQLPAFAAAGVDVYTVGLGSLSNAREFAKLLQFPLDQLYADPEGGCYSRLGFSPGFQPGGQVDPYLKLLPMLMGIGSPGTVQEVARGYIGDRSSKPVFDGSTPFDILGTGYQRPFELATLRLFNMVNILPRWGQLCPPDRELLVQQGGTLVLDGTDVIYRHDDSGILKYTDLDQLLSVALERPVAALPSTTTANAVRPPLV